MGDEMTDGEIHELIAAAKADQRPGRGDFEGAAVSYDFKRPQQIQAEQTRRLESVHEQFARLLASTLSSSMRMVIDVEIAFCDQLLLYWFSVNWNLPSHWLV